MSPETQPDAPKWKPLNSRQRRVLGVLVEKAKTVPESYPMTVNGIVAGSNQKSNREPQMELTQEDVEQLLEELRALGAVTEVQGSGRVLKYRHHAYEWLGVTAVELAVMTELLLRGEQTLGDLRARAARMEPIADQAALKTVVDGLLKKGLMREMTPPGRGQIVSHNLYKDREVADLQTRAEVASSRSVDRDEPTSVSTSGGTNSLKYATADQLSELAVELAELRAEFARMRQKIEELESRQ
ncbi:MAG: YceH family protein [Planctomycetales bacterium]|nr:YceH family protein [Planctomycetales bacterium]